MRNRLTTAFTLTMLVAPIFSAQPSYGRATLLLEEPYGFFGTLIPTGHNAIYIEDVCAETSVVLRRCEAGKFGVVLTRDEGIGGYDWVAIPLLPEFPIYSCNSKEPLRKSRCSAIIASGATARRLFRCIGGTTKVVPFQISDLSRGR
jgi:hypothetical protein